MRVLFALRQSPDWQALAARHATGEAVPPAAYLPAHAVPAHAAWMAAPVARTAALFARALD